MGKGEPVMDRRRDTGQPAKRRRRTGGTGICANGSVNGTGGFTLVELIVAFSVSLIVIGVTTAMLLAGTNMARHTTQSALEEQIVDGVSEFVGNRIKFAATVEAKTSIDLQGTDGILYVGDSSNNLMNKGVLFFRNANATADTAAVNILGEDYYMDHTISLDATITQKASAKPVVSVKITLYNSSGTSVAERTQTYTLINGAKAAAGTSMTTTTVTSPDFLSFKPPAAPTPSTP
jgi:type II secretory pathway component PulJ